MNSKLCIAALCATAASLPVAVYAQTSVTVYGLVDTTIRHQTNATASGAALNTVGDGVFTGSRFGLRGSEDLGDGYKAVFSLENGFAPDTGVLAQGTAVADHGSAAAPSGRIFGREAYVGLESPVGLVTLGRQYTLAHSLSNRFQPMPNPNNGAVNMFSNHQISRQDNMVRYSKQFGPVGVHAAYTFSEGNGKSYAAGFGYAAGDFEVVAFYEEVDNAANTTKRDITSVGGNYAVTKELKAFLGYMKRHDHGASTQENDIVNIGANYSLTGVPVVLTVSYGQDRQSVVGAGTRRMGFVSADYLLSKRTDIYAVLENNHVDGAYTLPSFMGKRGTTTGATLGLRHRF